MALDEFKLLVSDLQDAAQLIIDTATGADTPSDKRLAVLSLTRETKMILERLEDVIFTEMSVAP